MKKHSGFTLVELVITIALIGIVSVITASRFANFTSFSQNGTFDQVKNILKLARQTAISQKRNIYPIFSSNTLVLCYQNTSPCPSNQKVTTNGDDYSILIQSSDLSISSFSFNSKGNTGTSKITITAYGRFLYVEEETGMIHE